MNMYRLFFILLCFVSVQFRHAKSLKDMSFGTEETLDIASWNIEWFPKNDNVTPDSVATIIEALDFDIIGIQEVDDTTVFKNMVATLEAYEAEFKTTYFAGLAYVYKPSTVELLDYYEIYSSNPYWNAFPRSPKVLEIMFQGEKVVVINNHFKCCGNGSLDLGDLDDEENRRLQASNLLKLYIETNFADDNVVLLGDLNDILTDDPQNNVFQEFLDEPDLYRFEDMAIAEGSSANWSYPSWPSHLDHILITNELFDDMENEQSEIQVIKVGDYMSGGFDEYDAKISDHRPVAIKIEFNETSSVGVEEDTNSVRLAAYPNPSAGEVYVKLDKEVQHAVLEIYSAGGSLIKSFHVDRFDGEILWNAKGLPAGVYYLKLMGDQGMFGQQKIVLQSTY